MGAFLGDKNRYLEGPMIRGIKDELTTQSKKKN